MAVQTAFPSMHSSTAIVGVLIAFVILFFGRRLFWLCVAAVGFAAGVEIAPHIIQEPSSILGLIVALALGLLGALLAIFLQKVAIAVLGFWRGALMPAQSPARFLIILGRTSRLFFLLAGLSGLFFCFRCFIGLFLLFPRL